jgi:hypothetical protein
LGLPDSSAVSAVDHDRLSQYLPIAMSVSLIEVVASSDP